MPKINIIAQMPKIPNTLAVYRVVAPKVDQAALNTLAKKFKLGAKGKMGSQRDDHFKLTYEEGSVELALHKLSGAMRFKDKSRWQVDDGESSMNLSDDEIIKRGKKHVEKFELAKSDEFEHLRIARLHVGDSDTEGKQYNERIIDAAVCFQRTINGIPVDGPGGKINIFMDHNSDLTAIHQTWRTKGKIEKKVDLKPAQTALDDLKKLYPGDQGVLEVHTIRFGYFELGPNQGQEFIQPAYVILFRLKSSDERFVMNSVHVSPASTEPIETITPPPPRPVQQKPRG